MSMKITRVRFSRAFLLFALVSSYVYAAYGKESPSLIRIVRNAAWNDFVTQIKFSPDDSPQNSLDKEILVIQKFLKALYDLVVFRAIDKARARLQRADKDLETLRNELSYREEQAKLGR